MRAGRMAAAVHQALCLLRGDEDCVVYAAGKQVLVADTRQNCVAQLALVSEVTAACTKRTDGVQRVVLSTEDKTLHICRLYTNGSSSTLRSETGIKLGRRAGDVDIVHMDGVAHGTNGSGMSAQAEDVVVVGDKVGDVSAYPLAPPYERKRHLLSHFGSIITGTTAVPASALTAAGHGRTPSGVQGQGYLLSADRDEKVRVSRWPAAFSIVSYCLGHTRFVSALHVLQHAVQAPTPTGAATPHLPAASRAGYKPLSLLVSGGGDGTLRLWHITSGTLLHTLYLRADGSGHSSAGQHEDEAMAESGEDKEGAGGGDGGQGGKGKKPRREEAESDAGDLVGAPALPAEASAIQAAEEQEQPQEEQEAAEVADGEQWRPGAAGTTASGAQPASIPDTALGVKVQSMGPARTPVRVVSLGPHPSHGQGQGQAVLLATHVHGEHAVRFVVAAMDADSAATVPVPAYQRDAAQGALTGGALCLAPGSAADGSCLPRAALTQVGTLSLPVAPIAILAHGNQTLLVLSARVLGEAEADKEKGAYQLDAYTVHRGEAGVHALPAQSSSQPSLAWLSAFNVHLARPPFTPEAGLRVSPADEEGRHGCMATQNLKEVDKGGHAVVA